MEGSFGTWLRRLVCLKERPLVIPSYVDIIKVRWFSTVGRSMYNGRYSKIHRIRNF